MVGAIGRSSSFRRVSSDPITPSARDFADLNRLTACVLIVPSVASRSELTTRSKAAPGALTQLQHLDQEARPAIWMGHRVPAARRSQPGPGQ
jgi:hypothetical protein